MATAVAEGRALVGCVSCWDIYNPSKLTFRCFNILPWCGRCEVAGKAALRIWGGVEAPVVSDGECSVCCIFRRPTWLGRLSSCLLKSIS